MDQDRYSDLYRAVFERDRQRALEQLSTRMKLESRDIVSAIDELVPIALMEANLPHANFHRIKMALFIRRLAREEYFSEKTLFEVLKVVVLDLINQEWTDVRASKHGLKRSSREDYLQNMVEEINRGNVHNAFYYLLGSLEEEPDKLFNTLLRMGTSAIPHTLGHSLSCFLPVINDIVLTQHPRAAEGLFSYLMYLSRFEYEEDITDEDFRTLQEKPDYNEFCMRCSSGEGIVNLHHMITLYIAVEWEESCFNTTGKVPYGCIYDWVGDKQIDTDKKRSYESFTSNADRIEQYEQFQEMFSIKDPGHSASLLISLAENDLKKAIDWGFRIFASYYTDTWDPHYFTGLYCALRLYQNNKISDRTACRVALDQAVRYFIQGIEQ